jgi:hypothetical protein
LFAVRLHVCGARVRINYHTNERRIHDVPIRILSVWTVQSVQAYMTCVPYHSVYYYYYYCACGKNKSPCSAYYIFIIYKHFYSLYNIPTFLFSQNNVYAQEYKTVLYNIRIELWVVVLDKYTGMYLHKLKILKRGKKSLKKLIKQIFNGNRGNMYILYIRYITYSWNINFSYSPPHSCYFLVFLGAKVLF